MTNISERTAYQWLAGVSAVAAAGTVFLPGVLHGPAAMNGSARGTALVLLVVGVPLLLAVAARGAREPADRVVVVGVVAYVTYQAVLFLFATPFNELFLVYVALFGSALACLTLAVTATDVAAAGRRFGYGRTSRRVAGFVGFVTVANTLLWLAEVVPGLANAETPAFLDGTGLTTNPIFAQDLAVWLPLCGLAAVLLRRERAWGVVLSGAALTMWAVEGLSVAVDQWFGAHADPGSPAVSSSLVVPFVVLATVCLLVLGVHLRQFRPGPEVPRERNRAPQRRPTP